MGELIASEEPSESLSDIDLVALLRTEGVELSGSRVQQYRSQLAIPHYKREGKVNLRKSTEEFAPMSSQPVSNQTRHDYRTDEIAALFALPFTSLLRQAQEVHHRYHAADRVQLCSLLSIKTGGCREDCGYCPQSARHNAELQAEPLLDLDTITVAARAAKERGATRFCMGAAWRSPPTRDKVFARLLEAATAVKELGLQVCMTLGMLDAEQARQLKQAGVYAYNHNLDTSPRYYPQVITTRTYADRLATLRHVRAAGMTVCCGGIVGMGEERNDRVELLQQLSNLDPHPEKRAHQPTGACCKAHHWLKQKTSISLNSCAPSPLPASSCRAAACASPQVVPR